MMSKLCKLKHGVSRLKFNSAIPYCNNVNSSLLEIIEDDKKRIGRIVMKNPAVNALTMELMHQLIYAVNHLEKMQFRGFILQSNLSTIFSAGLDINELYKTSEKRLQDYLTVFFKMWKTFYISPLITIAAINGHAPAGGCVLALSCDQRIMAESTKSRIGLSEVLLGFTPPKWVCHSVVNVIGIRKAEDAIMTGKLYTPEEALALGLVDKLVPPSELLSTAEEEMDSRLKVSGSAVKMTKRALRQSTIDAFSTYEKADIEERVHVILSDEVQRSIKDYFDKLKKR